MSKLSNQIQKFASLCDEVKELGALSALTNDGKRELPLEYKDRYFKIWESLKANYRREREKIIDTISSENELLQIRKIAKNGAVNRAEQWQQSFGTQFITSFLNWAGILNILAIPSLIKLMKKSEETEKFGSIVKMITSIGQTFQDWPWVNFFTLVLLIIPVVVPYVLTLLPKYNINEFLQMNMKKIRNSGIVVMIGYTFFLSGLLKDNEMVQDFEMLAVMAAALGIPCLFIQLVIIKRKVQHEKPTIVRITKRFLSGKIILGSMVIYIVIMIALYHLDKNQVVIIYLLAISSIFAITGLAMGLVLKGIYLDEYFKKLKVRNSLVRIEKLKANLTERELEYLQEMNDIQHAYLRINTAFVTTFDYAALACKNYQEDIEGSPLKKQAATITKKLLKNSDQSESQYKK